MPERAPCARSCRSFFVRSAMHSANVMPSREPPPPNLVQARRGRSGGLQPAPERPQPQPGGSLHPAAAPQPPPLPPRASAGGGRLFSAAASPLARDRSPVLSDDMDARPLTLPAHRGPNPIPAFGTPLTVERGGRLYTATPRLTSCLRFHPHYKRQCQLVSRGAGWVRVRVRVRAARPTLLTAANVMF